MRDIKFRAWSHDNKEMYYPDGHYEFWIDNNSVGFYPRYEEEAHFAFNTIPSESEKEIVVMQFTGLKDKNGKEIYEGDICEGHSDGIGVITWTEFDGGYDYIFTDDANVGIWEVKSNIKVIGNIYETPELLNKERKEERSVAHEEPQRTKAD